MRKFNKGDVIIEWDDEYECWGVFCDETGFCFNQFNSEEEAKAWVEANG